MKNNYVLSFMDICTVGTLEDYYKESNGPYILAIQITKDLVDDKEYNWIKSLIDSINDFKKSNECQFMIVFNGYDSDAREVYEIPEITEYIYDLLEYDRTFLQYLCNESLKLIFMIYAHVTNSAQDNGQTQLIGLDSKKIIRLAVDGAFDILQKYHDVNMALNFLDKVTASTGFSTEIIKQKIKDKFCY